MFLTISQLRAELQTLIEERAHLAETYTYNRREDTRVMLLECDAAIAEVYDQIDAATS